ncbi:MAG: hypothetical protein LBD10_03655 [Desulfobulbus sp.]|jgi:hypothetical protein|uniref:hypothetical protein n=1 Tax=Desulfobulbus sp. TaxID=895 RepID=UPI00283DBD63|nr:hypothetical protein [Desulfobulbus sp.]MDR2549284.1 hypothetical protein [Desulfobulbus sp.]
MHLTPHSVIASFAWRGVALARQRLGLLSAGWATGFRLTGLSVKCKQITGQQTFPAIPALPASQKKAVATDFRRPHRDLSHSEATSQVLL